MFLRHSVLFIYDERRNSSSACRIKDKGIRLDENREKKKKYRYRLDTEFLKDIVQFLKIPLCEPNQRILNFLTIFALIFIRIYLLVCLSISSNVINTTSKISNCIRKPRSSIVELLRDRSIKLVVS